MASKGLASLADWEMGVAEVTATGVADWEGGLAVVVGAGEFPLQPKVARARSAMTLKCFNLILLSHSYCFAFDPLASLATKSSPTTRQGVQQTQTDVG